jgi:hypothetical protein
MGHRQNYHFAKKQLDQATPVVFERVTQELLRRDPASSPPPRDALLAIFSGLPGLAATRPPDGPPEGPARAALRAWLDDQILIEQSRNEERPLLAELYEDEVAKEVLDLYREMDREIDRAEERQGYGERTEDPDDIRSNYEDHLLDIARREVPDSEDPRAWLEAKRQEQDAREDRIAARRSELRFHKLQRVKQQVLSVGGILDKDRAFVSRHLRLAIDQIAASMDAIAAYASREARPVTAPPLPEVALLMASTLLHAAIPRPVGLDIWSWLTGSQRRTDIEDWDAVNDALRTVEAPIKIISDFLIEAGYPNATEANLNQRARDLRESGKAQHVVGKPGRKPKAPKAK